MTPERKLGAREYAAMRIVGGIALVVLLGLFGYSFFALRQDAYDTMWLIGALVAAVYVAGRIGVAFWRRRSR